MKKILLTLLSLSSLILADGGGIGVQLGKLSVGIGGSCNGPIIGVGPSPDNGRCFSAVVIPGDCCGGNCCKSSCSCNSCGCNRCG